MVEIEQREECESSQELDVGLQLDNTDHMTEHHLDDKRAGGRDMDGEKEEKRTTKASTLMSWLRKM